MEYFTYRARPDDDRVGASSGCSAVRRAQPESQLTQREMDLARSVQDITEEVMLKMARVRATRDRPARPVPGRRRRAQLRRQRPDPARGTVRADLDSAGGRRRRRRARRRAEPLAPASRQAAIEPGSARHVGAAAGESDASDRETPPKYADGMSGSYLGSALQRSRDRSSSLDARRLRRARASSRAEVADAGRRAPRGGEGRRPAAGPHGVRPARARRRDRSSATRGRRRCSR